MHLFLRFQLLFVLVVACSWKANAADIDPCQSKWDEMNYNIDRCLNAGVCNPDGDTWHGTLTYQKREDYIRGDCRQTCPNTAVTTSWFVVFFPKSCLPELKTRTTNPDLEKPNKACGSIIQTETRVLGESIPVTGVSFELQYFSSWVQGRIAEYQSPTYLSELRQQTVDSIIMQVHDEFGNFLKSERYGGGDPYPDYVGNTFTYTWNGLDSSSKETWGRAKRKLYISVIQMHSFPSYSFSEEITVGNLKAKKLGLGGWVPSNWHFYDIASETLIRGDGTYRKVKPAPFGTDGFQVPEPDGSILYQFDKIGRLVRVKTGFTGQVIRAYTYDSRGYLSTITESFGRVTRMNRNSAGDLISITAPNGKVTRVSLNTDKYLASVTNPKAEVFGMTYYDAGGLLKTFKKPNLATSTFTYDSVGNLITDVHSGGFSSTLSSIGTASHTLTSAMGRKTSSAYSHDLGVTVQFFTDSDGTSMRTEILDASTIIKHPKYNISQSFVLDPRFGDQGKFLASERIEAFGTRNITRNASASLYSGDPTQVQSYNMTETNGPSTINTSYMGDTKTWSFVTSLGRTRNFKIDNYERLTSFKIGNQTSVLFTYTNEKLTKIQQGIRVTSLIYDPTTKLLTSVTNPLSQVTKYSYNSAERLSSQTLPDGRVIQYNFDFQGNLLSLTPPGRPLHSFTLNSKELVSSYKPPVLDSVSSYQTTYSYNNDRQLTKITRPDGKIIAFNYHPSTGVLTSISQGATTRMTLFENGFLKQISDSSGYQNDLNYQGTTVSSIHQWVNSVLTGTFSRSPNFYGNIGQDDIQVGSTSLTTDYTYDADELLTGAGSLILSYDTTDGKLIQTTLGNLTEKLSYNTMGEVTGATAKKGTMTLYSYTLIPDALGRVSQKTEVLNGITTVFNYKYDPAGRLYEVKRNGVAASTYSYDDNSNRNGGVIRGTTTTASYDLQDRLKTFNANNYSYNLNGDLQSKLLTTLNQTTTFDYDAFGNLKKVILPKKTVIYEINPLNQGIGRIVNGVLQRRYLFDPEGRLIAELSGANALLKKFVYASKFHVPDYYIDAAGATYRMFTDYLGSVRLIVKTSTGVVVQRMEHDEFGRVLQDTAPGLTPFGFAGGIYDPDTGLVRFGARDYDPETGRWTSKDPILFNGGDTNLYGYVMSDPVNFIDPEGKAALVPGLIFVGGIVLIGNEIYQYITDPFYEMKREELLNQIKPNKCGPPPPPRQAPPSGPPKPPRPGMPPRSGPPAWPA